MTFRSPYDQYITYVRLAHFVVSICCPNKNLEQRIELLYINFNVCRPFCLSIIQRNDRMYGLDSYDAMFQYMSYLHGMWYMYIYIYHTHTHTTYHQYYSSISHTYVDVRLRVSVLFTKAADHYDEKPSQISVNTVDYFVRLSDCDHHMEELRVCDVDGKGQRSVLYRFYRVK